MISEPIGNVNNLIPYMTIILENKKATIMGRLNCVERA